MKTKLWLFLIALPLVFTACEQGDDFGFGPPAGKGIKGGRVVAELKASDCMVNGVTPLIAGQHYEVGKVTVKNDGVNIVVTYETNPGWFITETHLHITKDRLGFPVNSAGNPMIGIFMFGNEHEFKKVDGNKVIYTIPWEPACYYIAAHAVVSGFANIDGKIDLEAFAQLLPETATVAIDHPANNTNSYFNVHVSNAGFLNGKWPGWCIQTGAEIAPGSQYDTKVYSSYENVPGYDAGILMKINWILNQRFIGQGYSYGEIQIAMWTLLLGYEEFNNVVQAQLQGTVPNPLVSSVIGPWTAEKVNNILSQVIDITDFIPECGGVIAVVFVHNAQDLIIELPVTCGGNETAWGQGCRFVEQGNWAMYFQVCL